MRPVEEDVLIDQLDILAKRLLIEWVAWVSRSERARLGPFQKHSSACEELSRRGIVTDYLRVRVNDYAIRYTMHGGPVFFTGNGELAFANTEHGLAFVERFTKLYTEKYGQIIKVVKEF